MGKKCINCEKMVGTEMCFRYFFKSDVPIDKSKTQFWYGWYFCNDCFNEVFPTFNKHYKIDLWGNLRHNGCMMCDKNEENDITHALCYTHGNSKRYKWINLCDECVKIISPKLLTFVMLNAGVLK